APWATGPAAWFRGRPARPGRVLLWRHDRPCQEQTSMPDASATPDVEDPVVQAAGAGDEAAFAELLERHRRELHVHCYRMLGSFDEAEDEVQETFRRAWRGRGSVEGGPGFRAWLYRIATNACLDTLRSRRRR